MIIEQEASFVLLQESQYSSLERVDLSRYWGNGGYGVEAVESVGRSGGLVSLWDPGFFKMNTVEKERSFLSIEGFIKGSNEEVKIINVYAPQDNVEKRLLWNKLQQLVESANGICVVAGDFNVVRSKEDRRNSHFDVASAKDFINYIDEVDLHEFGLKGNRFTFVTGSKMSRIDRIFVSWNVGSADLEKNR